MTASASASPIQDGASPRPASKSPAGLQPEDATTAHEHAQEAGSASPTPDADSIDQEEGEIDDEETEQASAPPLPSEPVPGSSGPPLPKEPVPQADDGWECQWDQHTQAWFFYNRFTGKTQWENPRAPDAAGATSAAAGSTPASSASNTAASKDIVEGYNPAIHGDYDPNAWYAQKYTQPDEPVAPEIPSLADDPYAATAGFNRFTGRYQSADAGPGRHSDESKSKRQMNAFFDVDAAANADDGRSLKAERSNKRISKSELKAFKEKRRARKEEKRRAWLRD